MWSNFTQVLSELDGTSGEEEEEEEEEREDGGSGGGNGGLRVLVGCVLFLLIVSTLLGNTLVCAAVVKFRHLRSKLNWHRAGEEEEELVEELVEMMSRNFTNSSNLNTSTAAKSCVANLNKTYAISSSLISFYIPVVIMIATYTRIYRIAQTQIRRITSLERAAEQAQNQGYGVNRNQHQQNRNNDEASLKSSFKKETKVLKTLSIIMGVFVFCWLPFFVLNCTVPFCDPPCVSDTTFTVFVWFGWANSSLNPVIYAFNADFRRAFATILGCNRICSSNAVEAVNFSNEMVSYHHDTTLQKETLVPAQPQQHARTINVGSDHLEDMSAQFDEESLISNGSQSHNRLLLLPATVQLEDDPEISLETITPFTSVAGLESDALIPGQVYQDG
ncbi:D(1)-like dopamine receptor [Scomber scombrus]|uniref:D(1)-like dopamine receptor n=1 Tax=Scomber scombrus TaxID=13677 RepID=A0AAV1QDL7_SCOSC